MLVVGHNRHGKGPQGQIIALEGKRWQLLFFGLATKDAFCSSKGCAALKSKQGFLPRP